MTAQVAGGSVRRSEGWTSARIFMLVSAAYHVPLATIGLVADRTFPLSASAAAQAEPAYIFGIFETNGWHSLAALLIGLASVYFALRPEGARAAALAIGVGHVVVIVALAVQPPSTFLFASNGADQVIHAVTAVGGIGSGLLTRPLPSRRAAPTERSPVAPGAG